MADNFTVIETGRSKTYTLNGGEADFSAAEMGTIEDIVESLRGVQDYTITSRSIRVVRQSSRSWGFFKLDGYLARLMRRDFRYFDNMQ